MSPAGVTDRAGMSISTASPRSPSPSTSLGPNVPTSPRLPSPPPPVEDLSNPASPSFMPSLSSSSSSQAPTPILLGHGNRRIRKGTKAKDITGPQLVPLSELESAFQLQEHLAALLSSITDPVGSDHTMPLTRKDCELVATCPEGIDDWMWCYELTRRLTRDLNYLIVGLLGDNCTEETCPEMRASLWQYLCAVHDPPRSCCAMDYSVHTLDHAASTLCSTKHFPSRLNINANGTKQLSSIFRRLHRIFAHAWFLHRSVFWDIENEYGLYVFFRTVSDKYNLVPEDNLAIPTSANGGYDGITTAVGEYEAKFGTDVSENSDLSQGLCLENHFASEGDYNRAGDVPSILNENGSTKSPPNSSQDSSADSGILPAGDLPLFVFPGETFNALLDDEGRSPNSSDFHSLSLTIDSSNSELIDQSPAEGHQVPLKLDIQESEKVEPNNTVLS